MLPKLLLHGDPKRAPARNHRNGVLGLACAVALFGCSGRPKAKAIADKTAHREHKVIEIQESNGLRETGELSGPSSWSPGEDLDVWYRDAGDSVLVATRSMGRVLMHVDFNRSGDRDSSQDRVYALTPDLKVSSQYCRPTWATAAWGELKTSASVEFWNRAGSSNLILWKLPKVELSPLQDGADVTFEIFDERYQSSVFRPGAPFDAVVRMKYSKASGKGFTKKDAAKGKIAADGGSAIAPKKKEETGQGRAQPPSITIFRADPGSVERGSSALLRWAVTSATTVRIEPGVGMLEPQGEKLITPDQTTPYTLTADGPGGIATSQFTVNVVALPPPSITSFQGDPGLIQHGTSTVLRWSVSGRTTSVRIDPDLGPLPAQGDREVSPERTTQYTLTAEGPGGRVSSQFTVRVAMPSRPSVTFDAEPRSVPLGQSATLRWNVSGAWRVSIAPGIGSVDAVGSATIKPLASGPYTLTAEGPGGIATRDVGVSVVRPKASSGELIWTGNVRGSQLITIDKDHADVGTVQGSLPGAPCITQPVDEKHVSIASSPGPRNSYDRLVLRVTGNGVMRIVIKWSLL